MEEQLYAIGSNIPDYQYEFPMYRDLEIAIPVRKFISGTEKDSWYYRINRDEIVERSKEDSFLCWRKDKYSEQPYVGWNLIKIPLVRNDGIIHKLTHKEMAELKGFPKNFGLNMSNKEGLYRMITSENNYEGINLWTSAFEEEYKEEMADLFDKLMAKDDNGQKIVEEYTDYRSYLDYDIEIHKRDGSIQRFSDIYGEKSGSETQVPYYVAIAASFYQLYRYGNSIRIMLLDEAFDKMDDERIQSMIEFFNGLGLQVIMATPPAKIEVIGEQVGTVLTAIRVGPNSIVEEYDL